MKTLALLLSSLSLFSCAATADPLAGEDGELAALATQVPPPYPICTAGPAAGGCEWKDTSRVDTIYSSDYGPAAGYHHSQCIPSGRICWEQSLGGNMFRETRGVADFTPQLNLFGESPSLILNGSAWSWHAAWNPAKVVGFFTLPDGCRLKNIVADAMMWGPSTPIRISATRYNGTELGFFEQEGYGEWGEISWDFPAGYTRLDAGAETIFIKAASHQQGWLFRGAKAFYTCP